MFADRILYSAILEGDDIRLLNTGFSWDSYHLISYIWLTQFGRVWFNQLSSGVSTFLYTKN